MGREEVAQKIIELVDAANNPDLITISITVDPTGGSIAVVGYATNDMVVAALQRLNHVCIDQIVMNSQELPN